MRGSKILITGPSGQVAAPIARALAADNEVWGIARFTDAAARESLEKAGVRCETVNLAAGDFTGLPADFDYVLNLAVAKSGRWDKDLAANAESAGLLMAHCRGAKAFLHCSSAAVYDPPDDEPRTERAALGDNHKPLFPTYSISKIAGEVVVRTMARALGVPSHHRAPQRAVRRQRWVAVLPDGDDAGRHRDPGAARRAGRLQPDPRGRHHRDHSRSCSRRPRFRRPRSTGAANKPSAFRSGAPTSARSSAANPSSRRARRRSAGNPTDVTRMRELIGGTTVDWRDGMRRMVAKFHPELVG